MKNKILNDMDDICLICKKHRIVGDCNRGKNNDYCNVLKDIADKYYLLPKEKTNKKMGNICTFPKRCR